MSSMTANEVFAGRPWLLPAGIAAASAGALAVAYAAEHGFGLEPCALCLYQRVPYVAAAALAGFALVPAAKGFARPAAVLAGLVFLVGAALAFYHVGVERHWWPGTEACAGELAAATSVAELKARLTEPPAPRCDEVAFSLFGVSMAGYNGIASLALAAFALAGARALGARR
jgi:disulfide bond formation protein DsbB